MEHQSINSTLPSNYTFTSSILDDVIQKQCQTLSMDSRNGSHVTRLCCFTYDSFLLYSLLPSVFILLLLWCVESRKKVFSFEKRFPCVRNRFGIVVPLDFTSSLENRWSYAFAFGAVTPHIFRLFFGIINPFPYTPPRYLKVFVYLVSALEVGVTCKPFFICLSTPNRLLGSFLGLLYTLAWFTVQLWDLVWCKSTNTFDEESIESFTQQYEWLFDIPNLLCLGFLSFQFIFMLGKDVMVRLNKQSKEQKDVKKHQYKHVQRLLKRPVEVSVQKSWFQRSVYDWDPYFKFPNRIIATVLLSFFTLYLIVLCEQILSSWCIKFLYEQSTSLLDVIVDDSTTLLNYATYSWYVTSAFAAFSSLIHISHVLVYYRKQMKSLWAGDKKHLPKTFKLKAAVNVVGLLKYPGYQIAFTMWGYLIVHVAMFSAALLFVYLVIFPIQQYGFLSWLLDFTSFMTNFFIMFVLMKFQRIVIHTFFLQDKTSPQNEDKPLALNNRKAFHNLNYYLYFFNVIMGVGSCVLRLIRSATVALMLLSRIERTIMPQGFKKLDTSHYTWLGMIITDHHHSNPVLVCFCHLLLKCTLRRVQTDNGVKPDPPVQKRALLRWLLMYTLLRNPTLILLRKRRWYGNRKALELAFIWAMTARRPDRNDPASRRSAFKLIFALHGSSCDSEVWWEGLRTTGPP